MLRPPDLFVLLGLLRPSRDPVWSVRSLAGELQLPPAAVQRSLARLAETPAYDAARKRINHTAVEALLAHAVPFIAPARLGAPTRGIPTAWAAPPLSDELSSDELPPIWPDPLGATRGLAVEPLHESARLVARTDPWLYEMLALVDGLRVGDARVRRVAGDLLRARLAGESV